MAMGLEVPSSQSATSSRTPGAAHRGIAGSSSWEKPGSSLCGEAHRALDEDGGSETGQQDHPVKPLLSTWSRGSSQAARAHGQHPHSSSMGPRHQHWVMWEAFRILTESKHLPCSGLREASQVEQSPRRGLLSRVLYCTTATRICIRSGWACVTQSHEHTPSTAPQGQPSTSFQGQGQSLCPAPTRLPATPILVWHSHLKGSPPLLKTLPVGKGIFLENHCCKNALHSWQQ